MICSRSPFTSLAIAALLCATLIGAPARAQTTYTVNETITGPLNGVAGNPSQTDSVVGTITTDGTLGVIHAGNIVGWNLDLLDVTNPQYSYLLTNSNSLIPIDFGSVLSATATGLFFDFTNTGAFAFQASNPGPFSGYHYWCLSANYSGCLSGNSIAPDNVYAGSAGDDLVTAAAGTQGQVGNSPLDQGPIPAVPEPSTYVLLALGLAGVTGLRRKVSR